MDIEKKAETDLLTQQALAVGVPPHLIGGIVRYVVHHIEAGGFLTAVLENDLMEAFGRADEESARGMKNIAMFLYNYAPSGCFKSPAKVKAWLENAS